MMSLAPSSSAGPYLAEVARPRHPFLRLVYFASRRRLGRTPAIFRVVYARAPWIAFASMVIVLVLERLLRLDARTRLLVQLSVASAEHCSFCEDLTRADAARLLVGRERFRDLATFEASDHFSPAEKAALAYAQAVIRGEDAEGAVRRLREHFDERVIVEIVWVTAVERYFTSLAKPLGLESEGFSLEQQEPDHG
jgi:alkylhydroperoxidase family enzyme